MPPETVPGHDNVTLLRHQGREIYIVGTAHISPRSVDEVHAIIDEVRPDTVCVELDATRHRVLTDDTQWRNLDIFEVIKQKKVLFLLSNLVLSAYQKKMGEALGVKPGAELLAAVEAAEAHGAELVLADRDIQATLKRTWRNLSLVGKAKIVSSLLASFFASGKITPAEIEKLKDRDNVNEILQELARTMPAVKEPLIDERDRYLMSKIQDAPGQKIVAVVGAGHVEGICRHLGEEVDLAELERIPPGSPWTGLLKWIVPIVVLAAFYYGYTEHSGDDFVRMIYAWILPNSVLAAVMAAAALAKPLTIAVAFVGSPITSLNPMLGSGMVTGLLEAWLRKPTVEECEQVPDAARTVRGFYKNSVTRVMLVALLTTIGSALGGWIGATWVVTLL